MWILLVLNQKLSLSPLARIIHEGSSRFAYARLQQKFHE